MDTDDKTQPLRSHRAVDSDKVLLLWSPQHDIGLPARAGGQGKTGPSPLLQIRKSDSALPAPLLADRRAATKRKLLSPAVPWAEPQQQGRIRAVAAKIAPQQHRSSS